MVELSQAGVGGILEQNKVVETAQKSLFQKLKGDESSSIPMSIEQIDEVKMVLSEYKGKVEEFFDVHGAGEKDVTPEEYYKRCMRSLAVEEAKTTADYTALCDMIDSDIKTDLGELSTYYSREKMGEIFDVIFASHRLPRQRDGKELAKVRALLEGGIDKKFAKFLLDKGYCGLLSPLVDLISKFIRPTPKKAPYKKKRSALSDAEKKQETSRVNNLFISKSGINLFPKSGSGAVGAGKKVQISFHKGIDYSKTDFGKYMINNRVTGMYRYCKGSEGSAHMVFEITSGAYVGESFDIYSMNFHHINNVTQIIPKITIHKQ